MVTKQPYTKHFNKKHVIIKEFYCRQTLVSNLGLLQQVQWAISCATTELRHIHKFKIVPEYQYLPPNGAMRSCLMKKKKTEFENLA